MSFRIAAISACQFWTPHGAAGVVPNRTSFKPIVDF
jgi:hypothetical protein